MKTAKIPHTITKFGQEYVLMDEISLHELADDHSKNWIDLCEEGHDPRSPVVQREKLMSKAFTDLAAALCYQNLTSPKGG